MSSSAMMRVLLSDSCWNVTFSASRGPSMACQASISPGRRSVICALNSVCVPPSSITQCATFSDSWVTCCTPVMNCG